MKFALTWFSLVIVTLSYGQAKQDSVILAIAESLESSFYDLDNSYFNHLFDKDLFAAEFIIEDPDDPFLIGFNQGITKGLEEALAKQIIGQIELGASYDFFNYFQDENGDYYLLFRFFSDDGINYHQFYLTKDKDDVFKIGDVYFYLTGEYFSETMGRLYRIGANAIDAGRTPDSSLLVHIISLKQANDLADEGDLEQARTIYETIPDSAKQEKVFSLLQLKLLGDDIASYNKHVDWHIKRFPDDPSVYLLNIDKFINEKNYDEAIRMVDSLQQMTGDDFLDLYKANIYYAKGDLHSSTVYYEKLVENYPNYDEGYTSLLDVYINQDRYGDAVEILNVLCNQFTFDRADITTWLKEEYMSFCKSKEFKNWAKQK